jgi:hypothetical protein
MVERTQIYLTEKEKNALKAMARRLGKTQSELIRTAVDRLIDREGMGNRLELLRSARGMWKNRADLPDLHLLRGELDRTGSGTE